MNKTPYHANDNDNLYNLQSPIECYKLNIIAIYCCFLFTICLVVNSRLLIVFYQSRELRTSSLNRFVILLTALDLLGSVLELPFVIVSNFSCRWIFGKIGCLTSGFIMTFVGMSSIYLMIAFSIDRYQKIYTKADTPKFDKTIYSFIICLLFGLFWALAPLYGWSYYTLEGGLTSCCVKWNEKSFNIISYNIALFIFGYLVPLIIIIFCNIKLSNHIKNTPNCEKTKKRQLIERKMTIIMMIYSGIFIFAWTPYAVVSMYSAFINPDDITPLQTTLPAMFAKSSTILSSIFFILSNKKILKRVLCRMNSLNSNEQSHSRGENTDQVLKTLK